MKLKLLPFLLVICLFSLSNNSYSQDSDADGTANNLDQDEDNDGLPDTLDGCSTIDIANTITIGTPIVNNSSYAIEETTITYTTTHASAFYGYVAGNQGDAIRFQGPASNEQLQLSFSVPVINVTFKLTDFDENEQLTVNAYDELNNLIALNSTYVPFKGAWVDRTGNFFENNDPSGESDGDDEADDVNAGVYFYFPGQISRIVFIYNTGSGQSLRFTELNYCLKDSDGDSVLDYLDIDSDNDGIPDIVEAGGVDTDGDGFVDNTTDNNGNGIPDIYDFRCTNAPAASGWATSVHASVNTTNANDALGSGTFSYADIGVGGSIELEFTDIIPAGNNTTIRHVRQSGSGQLSFKVERSADGITYSNGENFLTNFDGTYSVLSYQLLGGNTQFIKITNLSSETLGIDFAKYNFGLGANCSGINGLQILNLDVDMDGIQNTQDLDSDGDGIFDVIEAGLFDADNNGKADGYLDTDSDGFNDNFDGDVGNDGTAENTSAAAIPTGTDTNSDGVPNSYTKVNTDGIGYPNPFDIDSDDDGIPDNVEAQPTIGYTIPAETYNSSGLDTAYLSGISPEDTDGDGTPDFLDTDSDDDGTPDIEENGDANSISSTDFDADGLDDIFDSNTATFDVNDEVTTGNVANLTATFGDVDGDVLTGGNLDYRDLFEVNPPASAALDFDGVDDYAEMVNSAIDGLNDYTISCWFKYNGPALTGGPKVFVLGQKQLFEIYINDWGSGQPEYEAVAAKIYKSSGTGLASGWAFRPENWVHFAVTVSFDGTDTQFRVFRNGYAGGIGTVTGTINTNANPFRIGIINGATSYVNFEGWIDEVRVFDNVLSDDQIKHMVYQEIENNSGKVHGSIIPKDIEDSVTNATIPWADLISYHKMSDVKDGHVNDDSSGSNSLILHNMTSLQTQTAPMPYESVADGNWADEATWLHGDVWGIEDFDAEVVVTAQSPEPWSIVQIHHNITTNKEREALGMYIDSGKTLSTIGDIEIKNNWYLQLDGTLDLADDSQLIQTNTSDLVTSAAGKILRRQEGNINYYWYNYWSSPVGSTALTTLSDNNGAANNINNTPFSLNMLKDGTGTNFTFTSAFNEVGKISTAWIYKFQNGITYYDWAALTPSSTIQPGVAYTQKGTGNAGTEQQYIFEGKPNNGTILIATDDVDNDDTGPGESLKDVTLTTTLIGNPYPSALDAIQFINDNKPGTGSGVISGTIQLWEQWAGTSHLLGAYEGGYGYINTLTTVRAYQHADIPIANQEQTEGIKTPTNFIPVGQGFFVEVIEDGNIEFNNGQRVFKKEATGESVFYRSANTKSSSRENTVVETQILRLEFGVSSGASRSFVIGFSEDATDGYDYGLDGGLITDPPEDDMGSLLNGQQYVIQALAPITPDKTVDLVLHASGNFTYTLKSTEISNFPVDQDLFLRDNLTDSYFDLRSTEAYNFTSLTGSFTDRFQVIFLDPSALSTEEFINNNTLIYVDQTKDKLYVKQLSEQAKQLSIKNMLGQTIKIFHNVNNQILENGITVSNLGSGVYIISIVTDNNKTIDKKVIIN